MKELSIEEKAKAYDEVREKIAIRFSSNVADEIFSEYEYSKDEKIRKRLIEYFKKINKEIAYKDRESIIAWLEKQGEQKPYASETMNEKGDFDNGFTRMLEKEQKPADKVEPKFHEGDWVVYDHRAYQVVELPKEGYINLGLKRNGKIEFAPSTYCRHWTIQDAKDGDVLNSVRVHATIIFKGFADDGKHILAYCALQKGIFIKQKMLWDRDFEPASECWENALYNAMVKAGYEFDAEKKELKKIEQKPAWSEKDEKMIQDIINDIAIAQEQVYCKSRCEDEINWLKSLKDRYTWKPSEEQIEALESATENCAYSEYQDCLRELIGQLKKL